MSQQKLYEFAVANGFDPAKVPASDAANWVIKALTPATEHAGPTPGVPDLDTQNTLTFCWQQTNTISPTPTPAANWDLDVVSIPGPAVFAFYRTRVTATGAWSSYVLMNDQYNWGSTAPTVNATTGTITGGAIGNWFTDVKQYRAMYHSCTAIVNAPSLADQGMVVSGQVPPLYAFNRMSTGTGQGVGGPPSSVNTVDFPSIWGTATTNGGYAPVFDTLLQTCPRGEMRRAKDGVYIPHRFTDGQFLWQPSNMAVYTGDDVWGGNSSANWNLLAGYRPGPAFGRMNYGVMCFRGLGPQTSVQLFTRSGYECTVSAVSNFRPFLTPSCAPDMRAIEEYFRLAAMLSESYPADYNEKDTLTAIIGDLCKMLPDPWGKIIPIFARFGNTKEGKGVMSGLTAMGKKKTPDSKAVKDSQMEETLANKTTPQQKQQQQPKQQQKKKGGPVRKVVGGATKAITKLF